MIKEKCIYRVTTKDGRGRVVHKTVPMFLKSAWELQQKNNREQKCLHHSIQDIYDNQIGQDFILNKLKISEKIESVKYRTNHDEIDDSLYNKYKNYNHIPIYIIHKNSEEIFGSFYHGNSPHEILCMPTHITTQVEDPDKSQISKALREASQNTIEIPITAQRKDFDVYKKLINEHDPIFFVGINKSELWSFLRDKNFRRDASLLPQSTKDLSWRDAEILSSVQKYKKIRPGCDYEQEALSLIKAGLIISPNQDLGKLHLSSLGSEIFKQYETYR